MTTRTKHHEKAIARLVAAREAVETYKAEYGHYADYTCQNSPIELEARARYNELNNALWPFTSGKYPMPDK